MNITTNALLMTGANRCIGQRLVNEKLRRGAKKNFYVALVICATGWAQGTSFPQATQAFVGPQSPAASPAGSTILTSTLVLGKLTAGSSHIRYPVPLPELNSTVL